MLGFWQALENRLDEAGHEKTYSLRLQQVLLKLQLEMFASKVEQDSKTYIKAILNRNVDSPCSNVIAKVSGELREVRKLLSELLSRCMPDVGVPVKHHLPCE